MEERQSPASPEIDLSYFFRPLGKVFKGIGRGIENYYLRIVNNGLLFGAVIVIITTAAYCLRYVIKPAYRTEGIFMSRVLPGKYCETLIKNLNKLKGQANLPLLARELKISTTAAGTIRYVELSKIQDTIAIDDRDTSITVFTVELTLSNTQYLDSIQIGIVNYLENVPYAIKRKEAKAKTLAALKQSFNTKLVGLDSLKKLVSQSVVPRSEGKGIILGEPINPVSVYQAEVNYFREQLKVDEELELIDNIEIIQPFFKLNATNTPNYTLILIEGFLASLIATLIITPLFGKKPPKTTR